MERLEFLDEKELVHQLFDHYCVTLGWANGTKVNFDEMKNINRYDHRQNRGSINFNFSRQNVAICQKLSTILTPRKVSRKSGDRIWNINSGEEVSVPNYRQLI